MAEQYQIKSASAFNRGYDDYYKGASLEDNPYNNSPNYEGCNDWTAGYLKAHEVDHGFDEEVKAHQPVAPASDTVAATGGGEG